MSILYFNKPGTLFIVDGSGAQDPTSNKNPDFLKLPFGNLKLQIGKKADKKFFFSGGKKIKEKMEKDVYLQYNL